MREIKFRGKSIETGEWETGFVLRTKGHWWICRDDAMLYKAKYPLSNKAEEFVIDVMFEVFPETVGEFTGLKDKNGVDLDWWEGDILTDGEKNLVIEFDQGCFWGCWGKHRVALFVASPWDLMKKIGDKYTTPELLTQ